MGYNMFKQTTEAAGRAWKYDNKWIWSVLVLIGGLTGYSLPEGFDLPFVTHAELEAAKCQCGTIPVDVSDDIPEEPVVTPTINVEGY